VVIGRPVSFAGASPDDALARERYESALRNVGFEEIHHVYEPVAAAYFFAQRLNTDATILVADFGGGTSDFSARQILRRPHRPRLQAARPTPASALPAMPSTIASSIASSPAPSERVRSS